jgi:hypothetical protein
MRVTAFCSCYVDGDRKPDDALALNKESGEPICRVRPASVTTTLARDGEAGIEAVQLDRSNAAVAAGLQAHQSARTTPVTSTPRTRSRERRVPLGQVADVRGHALAVSSS